MQKEEIVIELLDMKRLKHDIEKLCKLEREIFGIDGYPRYFFRQSAELFGDTFLVCSDADKNIIGYLLGAVKHEKKEGWLLSMCVDESLRKKGIGSVLISKFLDLLKSRPVHAVFATVDPLNLATVNLYSKHGFKIQKLEQDYHGIGYHRYLMKKNLA